jgi:LemA protein
VQEYNTAVRNVPSNIIENFTNFTEKPKFKAAAGAEKAPEVFK